MFTSSLLPHSVSPSLYSFILWSTVKRLLHRQRINNKILGGDKWVPLRNQDRLCLLLCCICNVLISTHQTTTGLIILIFSFLLVMDGSLPTSLKHIISNAEYYGPSLFLLGNWSWTCLYQAGITWQCSVCMFYILAEYLSTVWFCIFLVGDEIEKDQSSLSNNYPFAMYCVRQTW